MSRPCEPFSCSLIVIVPAPTRCGPDASLLARALHDRLRSATLAVWAHDPDDIDLRTAERAAAIADDIQRRTGVRPDYVELSGDLREAVARLVQDARNAAVVTVATTAPRRIRTAVRRAAERSHAHLALVPDATPTDHHARELI